MRDDALYIVDGVRTAFSRMGTDLAGQPAIAEDPRGGQWLSQIIIQMDRLVGSGEGLPRVRRTNVPGSSAAASVSSGG